MKCAWQSLIGILPLRFRAEVDSIGRETMQEIRFRVNCYAELITTEGSIWLDKSITVDDISFVVNAASRYSPWTAATIRRGYITAPGGHRVGLCGDAVMQNGEMNGIRNPTSLCIRVARDFPGIARAARAFSGSVMIIGRPGTGKTTLLRDLIRQRSDHGVGCVGVVDERGELFPLSQDGNCFDPGKRTDVITGCSKEHGIELLLRTMTPVSIAVDEITAERDCKALMNAGWSGVDLLATAHADSVSDLHARPVYRPLLGSGLFQTILRMNPDKSWVKEALSL